MHGISDCNEVRKDVELRLNLNKGDYYSLSNPNVTSQLNNYDLEQFTTKLSIGPLNDPSNLQTSKPLQYLPLVSTNQNHLAITKELIADN